MNILFTNHCLTRFGGTEVVIRDLALKLMARGHRAVVYSSRPAPPGASLADAGIATIGRIEELPFSPDVIHGQHGMDAMTAVVGLPGVPALYCCHGATRFDAQPRHPRITLYTAMSESLKLRMVVESNIPEEMIEVVHNAVDLDKFRAVRDPAERPRRALLFNRMASDSTALGRAVGAAAEARGIALDFARTASGLRTFRKPEDILLDYDVVFASGKSAIDALACGCAVVVISGTANGWAPVGCGEMVGVENFERLRAANFAAPVNAPPPTAAAVGAQIDRYDAERIRATTRLARASTDLETLVDRYLAIYGRVIERAPAVADRQAERLAVHRYLRSLAAWVQLGEHRSMEIAASPVAEGEAAPPSRIANRARLVREIARTLAADRAR